MKDEKDDTLIDEIDDGAADDKNGGGAEDNPGEGAGEETTEDDGANAVGDEDIERAVKAGMPISTVRLFADKAALEQVVSLLEARREKSAEGEGDGGGGEDPDPEEEMPEIPDLENEDEFDPSLIKGYKAMKALLAKQHEQIKTLKAGGGSPGGKAWFDSKVGMLGDAYKESLGAGSGALKTEQRDARNKVKAKFDVLSAGYRQAKVNVSPDEVLDEALKLVVGNVSADASRAKSAADRAKLALQRASGAGQKPGASKSAQSVEREIADEINAKFFGK